MTEPKDRRKLLRDHTSLNGIDFIEIADTDQTVIEVHFLNPVPPLPSLVGNVTAATITGGDAIPTVPVAPIATEHWSVDAQSRPVLTLHVPAPGDFSLYTLTLVHSGVLDAYFDHALFSFKAGCVTTLDCEAPAPACPPPPPVPVPIDYLAKDYPGFKKALLDFSTLRFPSFRERSEADFGVMLLEALASLADDLSYYQDRVAAEASLETATERRSLVRHARLVDYEPRPVQSARVMLRFTAKSGIYALISSGWKVNAPGADGRIIEFSTGTGEIGSTETYLVRTEWNEMNPHWWDDADRCLPRGATEMWVSGHTLLLFAGQKLLIETDPDIPGDIPIRQIVTLAQAPVEVIDPLPTPQPVTKLVFREEDALTRERDLTRTRVHGNLVPAVQGKDVTESFSIPPHWQEPHAIVRTGRNGTPQYLHTLKQGPLAWLAPEGAPDAHPVPSIRLRRTDDGWKQWAFRRSLLDADWLDEVFTIDPARYTQVAPRRADNSISMDYAGGDGDTLRFGDGVFGQVPGVGATFHVEYRTSAGAAGNVAAGAITGIDASQTILLSMVSEVTNPFPAEGGADAETDESVRRNAPQAFRAKTFRAVRPSDYEAAAETLPWVDRAGTVVRHTGSWLTLFTAADPKGSVQVTADQTLELVELLDRRRLAGHESYVPPARYVSLDLKIEVCAIAEAFRGHVEQAVLEALRPGPRPDGTRGFFHPDNFTFGKDLERSALLAAIQRAYGVDGVRALLYRRRGFHKDFVHLPMRLAIGIGEIVRVDDNPSRPERGSIRVFVKGGK